MKMIKALLITVNEIFRLAVNVPRHFITITTHKICVMKSCFKVGLYFQGLCHDLSKYDPREFFVGVKYYQGIQSPNNAERKATGVSNAWLRHKGRNKHHYEYWTDYAPYDSETAIVAVPMPVKYVIEMFLDRVAAAKVYNGKLYTKETPLAYYDMGRAKELIHEKTRKQLEILLRMLANKGEDETFTYIREVILRK